MSCLLNGSCINFLKPLTQTGNPTTTGAALINKPTKKLAPKYPEKGWPWKGKIGAEYFWQNRTTNILKQMTD